jgi:phosphohistidine phosphatase
LKLHLMRHGHAHSVSEARVRSDAERPLSSEGVKMVREQAEFLLSKGARPSLILHSPLRRAVETAKTLAEVLKPKTVELFIPLANTLPAPQLLDSVLERAKGVDELVCVGHQPQLGELAQMLARAPFLINPGGEVSLKLEGEAVSTLWSRNPDEV